MVWRLDEEGTLTFVGSEMRSYEKGTAPWYAYRESIKKVVLSSGVLSIGEYAFSYCRNLNVASLKGGGKKLAFGAFFECEKLVAIELPQGMESIGNIAFSHCTNLYSVSLPSSLQEVGFESFKDCPCEKEVLQLVQKNKK